MSLNLSNIKLPNIPVKLTRAQLDKVFAAVLMLNSVAAIVGVIFFFISSWWLFAIFGTLGFPFLAALAIAYRYTSYREPIRRFVIKYVTKVYQGIVQKRASLLKKVYTMILWFVPSDEWKHITWGYATLSPKGELGANLDEREAEKKWFNQLYHFLATGMGNWNTLEGKDVLEIRSGGGAGLNYIAKHLNPNRAVGVDTSAPASDENQRNVQFIAVDSLDNFAPKLSDQKFDLTLSVQCSKDFSDFGRLIQEVDSVVKPGGIFAFADLRPSDDWAQLEKQLEGSSMRILRKENISKNVIQALKLNELEKFRTINQRFGKVLDFLLRRVGLIKDHSIVETLNKGVAEAHAYLLHKVPQRVVEWR